MTSHSFRLFSSLMRNNCRPLAVQQQRMIFTDMSYTRLKAESKVRGLNNCVQISTAANLQKELDDTFVTEATEVLKQIKKKKALRFNSKQVYAHVSGYNLKNYSEDYLNNLFSQFGSVQKVDINLVNEFHGYAIISFNDEESAQKALLTEKLKLDDYQVLLIKKRKETSKKEKRAFFIKALPYDITVTKLKEYLSVFCDVDRIHLMVKSRKIKDKEKDRTLGQNYAIVLLTSGFNSILERNLQLDDHSLIVESVNEDFRFRHSGDEHKKLLIEGLPKKISEIDLQQYFQKYGTVRHVYVEIDRSTKIPSGLGYVHFTESSSAQDAADILIQELNGSPVRVRLMGFQA